MSTMSVRTSSSWRLRLMPAPPAASTALHLHLRAHCRWWPLSTPSRRRRPSLTGLNSAQRSIPRLARVTHQRDLHPGAGTGRLQKLSASMPGQHPADTLMLRTAGTTTT
jgi:hypothetical protein